jgi:hypothetical protein
VESDSLGGLLPDARKVLQFIYQARKRRGVFAHFAEILRKESVIN